MKIFQITYKGVPYLLVLVFMILSLGIVTGSFLYYQVQATQYRAKVVQELSGVVNLKVGELTQWRKERLGDAAVFYKNSAFTALVRRCFDNPEDRDAQEQLRTWLSHVQVANEYYRLSLLDATGMERMEVPATTEPHSAMFIQRAAEVLKSGQMVFQDFYRDEHTQRVHLSIFIPVIGERDGDHAIGVLAMCIDPNQYLYPLINNWPTPSPTAETVLARQEGNYAVFLNQLRFTTNTILNLRVSLEKKEIPIVKAVMGQKGTDEGWDNRGVHALFAMRAIPDSPWFMVARIDVTEIYAPLRQRLRMTILLGLSLLCILGAVVGLIWYQQRAQFYRGQAKATEALKVWAIRYKRLFEVLKDGVLVLDGKTGVITDVNPYLVEMLGFSRESLLHKKIWELGCFKDIVGTQTEFVELEQKQHVRHEYSSVVTSNGRRIDVEFVSNTYQMDHQKVIHCTIRDITERKLAAKQLRQKNEELMTAYAYLNRVSQQQIETKDQILSHVSHELRTPLNAAYQFVTIFQDGLAGELNVQQHEYMTIIFRNLKQLQNMIDDILDVTRAQSGKLTNDPQRVQVKELIVDLFRTLRSTASEREMTLTLEEATATLPVYADPARLRQVITNLLDNAIKFTPSKGTIIVRVEAWKKDANFVCISTKDTGRGIPAAAALKIFDRLYQNKGAYGTSSKGLGLGLFICRELVTRMGGEIWVESEVSKGSTFYFTVPIYKGQEAAKAAGTE